MEVKRLFDFPYYQLENFPKEDSIASKVNGEWKSISTQQFIDQSNSLSRGLIELGVKAGDAIAMIFSVNRTEWNIIDIGVQQTGAINVPVYHTLSHADIVFIFNDANIKMCFASDKEMYDKVLAAKNDIPSLKEVYIVDELEGAPNWSLVFEADKAEHQTEVDKRKSAINTEDLATLIYTSGTTGKPKGVMLSHKNLVSNVVYSTERLPVSWQARGLSFLPLCHVYERMIIYLYFYNGVSLYYAESMDTIGDNLREVKPEVFTAVPRLLEKVFDKIMAKGAELSGIKKMLFYWAVSVAEEYEIHGKSWFYKLKLAIARKLIFSKWQEALGGKAKAVASGSAALQPRLARIFLAAGIPIMEGYGLTETSPVISVNCQWNDGVRIGTVGRPLKEADVKIAEDGEILYKGPNLMMGYYKRPDLTDEVIDKDGYFHTGDIGEFVEGDFLKITDRKKEIFKTSGGKYIAPQIIENAFKSSRFIEQLIIIGENEKHPAALIQLDFDFCLDWCERKGHSVNKTEELLKFEPFLNRFQTEIDKLNAPFGHWEQVKRYELTPDVWSIESGHLTPTLKLRRKIIMEKYDSLYKKIYSTQ